MESCSIATPSCPSCNWRVVSWNMCGYTTEKLEHLMLTATGPDNQPVLAYLLQETHLPAGTIMLGTPVDYLVL